MSKRAASISGRDAKRAKVGDNIEAVAAVLEDDAYPHDLPKSARTMLAIGARSSLELPVEERHVVHKTVLGHVQDALSGVLQGMKTKAADEKRTAGDLTAQVATLQGELQGLSADVESTGTVLEAQREKAAKSKEACELARDQVQIAEVDELKIFSAKDKLEAERAKYNTQQERLEGLLAGDVAADDGEAADAPAKSDKEIAKEQAKKEKALQRTRVKLVSDLTQMGAESTCLASALSVLEKQPEERQGFDLIVVKALRDFLEGKVGEVDKKLDENKAETAKASEGLTALREALAAATATQDADAAAEAEAQAKHDGVVKAKAAKEKAIQDNDMEISNYKVMSEVSDSNVADFEGLLGTWGELCARSSAPAPEEEAAAAVAE